MATLTRENLWEVSSRTIVYAAIGAALYAIASQFSFLLPGPGSVSVRPAFAFVTFFGFAFGPIVGLFVGLVGNMLGDQISGWGLLTSWNWSIAVGVVGLLAGLTPLYLRNMMQTRSGTLLASAIGSVAATIVGLLIVFSDVVLGTANGFSEALTANYAPAVISDVIVVAILTPILVAAWEPVKDQLGR
jgi:energy-coupling factor transport system substrate-specific component